MIETEIKLPVQNPASVRTKLRELGWQTFGRRRHEKNLVYDRPDNSLSLAGSLLRVRRVGKQCWLTVKRPGRLGSDHKVREEFEIQTRQASDLARILEALGFQVAWRYEKFRTEFRRHDEKGKILLDLTPVGNFLELEGNPSWIDRTARRLGYSKSDYITETYRGLFLEYQDTHHGVGRDMVFQERALLDPPE